MVLPSTQPLDGEFWYILDKADNIVWKPRPRLRGDFYLGWLGQNKTVVGAGLARIEQGQLVHICTHGTPYYWLQPYEELPLARDALHAQQMLGADTVALDFSLAGWGMRDQMPPESRQWPDANVSADSLPPLLLQAVEIIARNFRSELEPPGRSEPSGLLARAVVAQPRDPQLELLDLLEKNLGQSNVVPALTELLRHDVNVLPSYRQPSLFEQLPPEMDLPPSSNVARLVLSVLYHLAPLLASRRLSNALLLNSLRQRHPFDVTWGADLLVKCFGMPNLVRLLLITLSKEQSDQVRGNAFDLLQELGYGLSVGLEDEVLEYLIDLQSNERDGAFGQVVNSHLAFLQEYRRQRDTVAHSGG